MQGRRVAVFLFGTPPLHVVSTKPDSVAFTPWLMASKVYFSEMREGPNSRPSAFRSNRPSAAQHIGDMLEHSCRHERPDPDIGNAFNLCGSAARKRYLEARRHSYGLNGSNAKKAVVRNVILILRRAPSNLPFAAITLSKVRRSTAMRDKPDQFRRKGISLSARNACLFPRRDS